MTTPNEWNGEPHTIVVHSVRLPDGDFDDGELGYDIEHPPSCEQKELRYPGVLEYTCDIAYHESSMGLPWALRYSGTPITEPGTYRIQSWGTKYWTELGYEYDTGVAVISDD